MGRSGVETRAGGEVVSPCTHASYLCAKVGEGSVEKKREKRGKEREKGLGQTLLRTTAEE